MPKEKDFLDVIIEFCNLDAEHIEFAKKTLFKYKDDPVAQHLCTIVKEHAAQVNRFVELARETNSKLWDNVTYPIPLIIPAPDKLNELRVFPNILLNSYSGLENATAAYCHELFRDFLKEYEADLADDKRKQKWEPLDRAQNRLSQYHDMTTATALTRFVFKENQLKPAQIRDFAESIDLCRKPMEIKFAESPKDFVHMYESGPTSCMGFSAGDKHQWEFMLKQGQCPTSWYSYFPYTKGAYAEKNGKIVARTILFMNPKHDKNWKWVRIYSTNPEITQKFTQSLAEMGITQAGEARIEEGLEFKVPGIKGQTSGYAAAFPYLDAPINKGEGSWKVSFDNKTNEFTFYFKTKGKDNLIGRGGHVISIDYMALYCSTCNTKINARDNGVTQVEGDHVFCSDACACTEGYVKVMDGTGRNIYKMPSPELIDTNIPFNKMSTIKAATDRGFFPIMDELGIFPEENDYRVTSVFSFNMANKEGRPFVSNNEWGFRGKDIKASVVPVKINIASRVEHTEEGVYAAA